MTKLLSVLCAGLFAVLAGGSAQAAQFPTINPQSCQIPAACADMNVQIVTPGNGTFCSATGATPQTCNGTRGSVVTNALAGATLTSQNYVINNSSVTAASVVSCQVLAYSGTIITNGIPIITGCTAGAGTITVAITNTGANAEAGTVTIGFSLQQN
jgi:hypothetical protein